MIFKIRRKIWIFFKKNMMVKFVFEKIYRISIFEIQKIRFFNSNKKFYEFLVTTFWERSSQKVWREIRKYQNWIHFLSFSLSKSVHSRCFFFFCCCCCLFCFMILSIIKFSEICEFKIKNFLQIGFFKNSFNIKHRCINKTHKSALTKCRSQKLNVQLF